MNHKDINLTISVVSHLQADLVFNLLDDLEKYSSKCIKVILTLNLDESLSFTVDHYTYPIVIIRNEKAKGFGENHNQAFSYCDTSYFCVVNPDIRLLGDPFGILIEKMQSSNAALIAPLVVDRKGNIENSVRKYPSPISIIKKIFLSNKSLDYFVNNLIVNPDWVGGMFMLFKSQKYNLINGFDESYFLYYEDVAICESLRKLEENIVFCPDTMVIHEARRTSHKKISYLVLHLKSMLRFFFNHYIR